MECLVTRKSPDWSGTAVHPSFKTGDNPDGFKTVSLTDYKGKWVYLFFYPFDFTFVCPTELLSMSEHIDDFKKRGVEVLGVSIDSKFSHFNWLKMSQNEGGLEGLKFPLLEDLGGKIAEKFGCLNGDHALRATYLINPEGVVMHANVNAEPFGRSIKEHLRVVDAAQYAAKHGEVCPMDWEEGKSTMKGNYESKKDYFTNKRKAAR